MLQTYCPNVSNCKRKRRKVYIASNIFFNNKTKLNGLFLAHHVCAPGTYGYDCDQRCNCSEPGQPKACHHVTGTCSCLPGLTGVMCDIREYTDHVDMQCVSLMA
ncbi:laminin EGF-like protein [Dictyocaulus viviparus]|uniref:Laminin EGF-like protein n=1 Tax=Dictyocaulus viviparus TaxID=29172 RepID=A0A0D8XIF4_DICVI|nr:laminin EGF-like protein [Dictyocaulus viviparus]